MAKYLPKEPTTHVKAELLAKQIGDLYGKIAEQVFDREEIAKLVDSIVEERIPKPIEVVSNGETIGKLDERTHPLFEKVMKLAVGGNNVMMVGPAGCGKTHLAGQVAKALGRSFGSISGSSGVSEAQITGRLLPTGDNGKFEYTESPFIREYTRGGVFLFDEVDGLDPNVFLTVNQALSNDGMDVEARASAKISTFVHRHPKSIVLGSANTFGTGAGSLYVGRNPLDAASLDRWYIVQMDYDTAWEKTLADTKIVKFVWAARKAINEYRMRRVASTRMIIKAQKAVKAGIAWDEVRKDLLSGWTEEETDYIDQYMN